MPWIVAQPLEKIMICPLPATAEGIGGAGKKSHITKTELNNSQIEIVPRRIIYISTI